MNALLPLRAVQKQWKKSTPSPVKSEESESAAFHSDDFVLITDHVKCRLVRLGDISLLEAQLNCTLVHFSEGKLWIRKALKDCEHRLDSSIFFRANRSCIVNLCQVKQACVLKNGCLALVLRDGNEIVFSRRQSVLLRARRGL